MKQAHSQATDKRAVGVDRDTAKVRMGAMTPSFPPAKPSAEASKDREESR